jgi:hypothetical protein
MTIEKTWVVEQLTTRPEVDGNKDVVVMASWRIDATDGTHRVSTPGSSAFSLPSPGSTNYVPYADLTSAQVIQWIKASLGEEMVKAMEARIDEKIADKVAPTQQNLPLPWQTA